MENKTKILIILDGSKENEESIDFILKSRFFKFDEISLFLILNPVNPVNQIRENQPLYHDFVHDHGRKLANMYIDKIQDLVKKEGFKPPKSAAEIKRDNKRKISTYFLCTDF